MARILLFGGFVQSLTAAASLKAVGHEVVIAAQDDPVAKRCRSKGKYIEIKIDAPEETVLKQLIHVLLSERIDVVIPLEDAYAVTLSKYKQQIAERTSAQCAVPDWQPFSLASDKHSLLALCKEIGVGHPKTEIIRDNYDELASYVGFPSLIKPNHSEGSKGIVLVNGLDELKTTAPEIIAQYGECSLQEYVSNDHYYNLMVYRTATGEYSNYVVLKILRYYPIKGGSSCIAVTVEDEPMLEMCKHVLDKLEWVGMADFDILEKGEGEYKIIEINPRVPASLRGAEISGVNFPEIIVSDMLEGRLPKYDYKTGKYLRFLGLDMAWFVASPLRFKCKPSWFKFFGKNLHYEDGGWRDFPAMMAYIWSGIKKQLSPSFRKSKQGLN